MANIVEYVISLKDKFTSPMQRANRSVQQLNNSVGRMRGTTASASKGVNVLGAGFSMMGLSIAGVVAGLGAAIYKVGQMGMEMEQTRVRFETFTGSAEKGNAVIKELQKFAIATPFDDAQVLKAGQSLLAFGIEAENLKPILSTLGNISSATGKDFNELVTIYGKNKLAGIIQAEDLNQLTEAGIPVYESLAKQMGVSTDQVKKMGSEGKISFAMLEKSFDELGGKSGKWGDLMEKQSKTFGGRLSSLMGMVQNLGSGLGEMMLPMMGSIVDAGNTLMTFINTNKKRLGSMFKPLMDAFKPIKDAFVQIRKEMGMTGDSSEMLKSVFNGIATVIKLVSPIIKMFATVLATVYTSVFKIIKAFADWYKRTEWIQKAVKFLYLTFKYAFEDIATMATKIFGGIGDMIAGVFNTDWDQVKKGAASIGDGIYKSNEEIAEQQARMKKDWEAPMTVDMWADEKSTSTIADEVSDATNSKASKAAASASADKKLESAIGSASGSKSTTIDIRIDKLIERFENYNTNINESKENIRKMVLEALTGAVSDLSANYN
ncbi:tape measure domain-containing protein [Pontibacter aydingkolensis]|uniref:Tape measure protein n=1 Tax=Pontibacter aydingkolensis TaxID=1911536 RepID=A0ABS7CR63_9BACT|nr:tape measure protein [Pontibacter aydingkolensis]MBW7466201.1 tape measure protein [Pontibacter aydingkolensis]